MALRALLLLVASLRAADADSAIEIVSNLKTFRNGAVELFSSAAASLKEQGSTSDAARLQQWSDDWLSLLGVNKGITGLAKDFVLNYLGRNAYHDSNGPLIAAIQGVSAALPKGGADLNDDDVAGFQSKLLKLCEEGTKLFKEGGSLFQMLRELQDILSLESSRAAFQKGLKENPTLKKAFQYLTGPRPGSTDDDFDEGEL